MRRDDDRATTLGVPSSVITGGRGINRVDLSCGYSLSQSEQRSFFFCNRFIFSHKPGGSIEYNIYVV